MDIRSLKADASAAVDRSSGAKQVVLVYSAIVLVFSALATVVSYCLELEIAKTGGLSNIGMRSVLASFQTMLPLVQTVVTMCLEVGFLSATLRIIRGQYVSPNSLRMGFSRFWPLMRMTVLQSMIYIGMAFISFYFSVQLFVLMPVSDNAMIIATTIASAGSTAAVSDAMLWEMLKAMLPMLPLFAVMFLALMLPMYYRLRMSTYVLIDKPRLGALGAMRESRMMMKGNRRKLLKLDLSFWWFYVLVLLASAVAYGDMILTLLGITLPWSPTVSFFLFYGAFLVMQFALFYFFLLRVNAAYALTYEVIRPKPAEPQQGGVVLGNIFDLAREQEM